jgi:hypothetical protein
MAEARSAKSLGHRSPSNPAVDQYGNSARHNWTLNLHPRVPIAAAAVKPKPDSKARQREDRLMKAKSVQQSNRVLGTCRTGADSSSCKHFSPSPCCFDPRRSSGLERVDVTTEPLLNARGLLELRTPNYADDARHSSLGVWLMCLSKGLPSLRSAISVAISSSKLCVRHYV